jgi:hypothetical protein
MPDKDMEYRLVIDKAKKFVNHDKREELGLPGALAGVQGVQRALHKDVDFLQHSNTFTVEHPHGGSVVGRPFYHLSKRAVSSALKPAMDRQSKYNETATRSLLNLTAVSERLTEQAAYDKGLLGRRFGELSERIGDIEGLLRQLCRAQAAALRQRARKPRGKRAKPARRYLSRIRPGWK